VTSRQRARRPGRPVASRGSTERHRARARSGIAPCSVKLVAMEPEREARVRQAVRYRRAASRRRTSLDEDVGCRGDLGRSGRLRRSEVEVRGRRPRTRRDRVGASQVGIRRRPGSPGAARASVSRSSPYRTWPRRSSCPRGASQPRWRRIASASPSSPAARVARTVERIRRPRVELLVGRAAHGARLVDAVAAESTVRVQSTRPDRAQPAAVDSSTSPGAARDLACARGGDAAVLTRT